MGLILNKYGVEPTEEKVKTIREKSAECRTHQCRTRKLYGPCQIQRTVPVRFRDNCGTTQLTRQATEWQWGKRKMRHLRL